MSFHRCILLLLLHGDILTFILFQFLATDLITALVALHVRDNINIGAIHILQCSLVGVDSDAHSLVDTSNLDAVTRPHMIDEVLIRAQMDRLRGLTLRDGLGRLLNLDVLLVRKD